MFNIANKSATKQQSIRKPTKKKKNTYVVTCNTFRDAKLWSYCRNTPLVVVSLNGVPQNYDCAWPVMTQFPNPGAHNMTVAYNTLKTVMNEKLARTIVEYLDKETGQPIALLFPTNELMIACDPDVFMSRLNHASRRDLKYQQSIREKFMCQILQKTK